MRLSTYCALCLILFPLWLEGKAVAETPQDDGSVQVRLLEPGAEPRHVVRFTPQVGDKRTAELIMKMNQQISMGGNKLPSQAMPPQKMTMEVHVTDVAANGDIAFDFKYTDMKVIDDPDNPSPIASMIDNLLKPMIGSTGSGIVTSRGFARKAEFNIPEGLSPQIKQMLEGMKDSMSRLSSPVPAEPIGKGAKWEVVQYITANGMKLKQTTTHEIKQIDNDGFEMFVMIDQAAEPQDIKNPMLPAGTKLTLNSLTSKGTGKSTIVESSVFPISSVVSLESKTDMSVDVGGQAQQMNTDLTLEISLNQVKD